MSGGRPGKGRGGFALISTMLILTVLTIMVVAFLQSMRIERMTAKNYAVLTQAELLAESALEMARVRMAQAIGTNRDYTVFQTNATNSDLVPVLAISTNGLADPVLLTEWPLAEHESLSRTQGVNMNGLERVVDASGSALPVYRVPWIKITNSSGAVTGRVAYLVLDEQARFNLAHHRGEARTNWARTAAEISPFFGTVGLSVTEWAVAQLLVSNNLLVTPGSLGLAFSNRAAWQAVRHLYTSMAVTNEEVIPAGYSDAGLPKYDLNDLSTNPVHGSTASTRATNLAAIIDRNLPFFKTRDRSMVSLPDSEKMRYLRRLTASMVDYIDPDTVCTQVNEGEPAGRGLVPYVVVVAEYFQFVPVTSGPPTWTAQVPNRIYLQLWNPHTTEVTGVPRIVLKNRMRLNYGTGIVTPLADYDQSAASVTLRPNEFKVVEFPLLIQTVSSPTAPATTGPGRYVWWANSPSDTADQTTHPHFEFYWRGVLVDMSRRPPVSPGNATAGLPKNAKAFDPNARHYQVNSIPTFDLSPRRSVGDPRFTYASNYDWGSPLSSDTAYSANTRWNGRNRDTFPYNQDYASTWVLRDGYRSNPIFGNSPGSINTAPSSVPSPYTDAEGPKAPFYVRKGPMLSIGELGHIFDPAFGDDSGATPTGGTPASVFVAGGGRTLRIGQPEYSYWNNETNRASLLLDLFTVHSTNTPTGYAHVEGRINVNTAPVPVLAALFNQIPLLTDTGLATHTLIATNQAQVFAQALVAGRPYAKLSDLFRTNSLLASNFVVATNYTPALPTNSTSLAVFDRTREEAFARMVNLVTFHSRAFRVYAIGEPLSPNGRPLGRVTLEAVIALEPDSPGGTNRLVPVVRHRKLVN